MKRLKAAVRKWLDLVSVREEFKTMQQRVAELEAKVARLENAPQQESQ